MKRFFVFAIIIAGSIHVNAQNFKATQKSQEKLIKSAFKHKKVTEREYNKLMDEQEKIKSVIDRYMADGELDSHEKNVIHDKQERAAKRLKKYQTNGEVY